MGSHHLATSILTLLDWKYLLSRQNQMSPHSAKEAKEIGTFANPPPLTIDAWLQLNYLGNSTKHQSL